MAQTFIEKISEHTATIRGEKVSVWKVKANSGTFFVKAQHVHVTIDKRYWTDVKHLIGLDRISISEPFEDQFNAFAGQQSHTSQVYQQITCGHCDHVNLINLDKLQQGAHYCKKCRDTICIIINTHIRLKNGSRAGQIQTR